MIAHSRVFAAGLLLALCPLAFTTALVAQDAPPAEAPATTQLPTQVWAFETSDIPVDPGFTFGQLNNGMRYVIRRNATPEGTALVQMQIASGSLEEADSERGLSHYLEHMAFNGSQGIPEGEMVRLLEREGLEFGADTNAATGFENVTYMLNLPHNETALLDTALMLMRETASELTIAPDAVERERGVILAERRDRAGFQQRNFEDSIAFFAPGARYGERLPVGAISTLETATAGQIRGLYARTYTPANTVLVVVGDYPVEQVEAAIHARFADWASAPSPPKPEAGPIDIMRKGLTDINLDPALSESVAISRFAPWQDRPDTIANRRDDSLRAIGYAIINRRLARLSRGEDAPFRGARLGSGDLFEDARVTSLSINSADGEWRAGTLAALREVNQALAYGFTQAEVDEQLANLRTSLENAVKSADTRSHSVFVGAALNLVKDERIPTTPEWQSAEFERIAAEMTPSAIWQAILADTAPLAEPLIRFEGRTAPEGGEKALRAAFAEAIALPIAPPTHNSAFAFGYTDFGPPGASVSDTREPRLGLRFIRFANGVRLTLKQTTIREDRVAYALAIDGGDLMNTKDAPLRTYLVRALAAGGLGKHSQDDLASALAGRSVGFGLSSATDAFATSGITTPRDLTLQMQVLTALLSNPGYRREGEERFRKGIEGYFAARDATPGRALGNAIGGILSDNDPRFTLQSKQAYFALDYTQLEAAIGDRLQHGAIEVALVGDIDEAEAIAAVATTFGTLPPREAEFNLREDARIRSFAAERGQRTLIHKGEADQALIQWIWPTTDDRDAAEALRIGLLARVVQIALTDKLREDLGQAYSPSAGADNSHYYRGYGTFSLAASVDTDELTATRMAVADMLNELRTMPVSADMIERARRPLLEQYDNALKDLGGWIGLTERAQSEPEGLERWHAAPGLIRAITAADLRHTALKWLRPDRAVELLVAPEKPSDHVTGG